MLHKIPHDAWASKFTKMGDAESIMSIIDMILPN